jgi:hypothetical protein
VPLLQEKQDSTATKLLDRLLSEGPSPEALVNLTGAVGAGKTSIMRLVAEQARHRQKVPVWLTAPQGEVDSAAFALLGAVQDLKSAGVVNGEVADISNPRVGWSEKMELFKRAIEHNAERLVVLCDEPSRWYHHHRSFLNDTPDYRLRQFADWIVRNAPVRRVISGRIPEDAPLVRRFTAPRTDDGNEILSDEAPWDSLGLVATSLGNQLKGRVPNRSAWEMKLCVGLAACNSVPAAESIAESEWPADSLLHLLLDGCERQVRFQGVCQGLARLAISRTGVDSKVLDELLSGINSYSRAIIERILCDWNGYRGELHPLARYEALNRSRNPQRPKYQEYWHVAEVDRRSIHKRLALEYASKPSERPQDSQESLHHELLAGNLPDLLGDARVQFVEQLNGIGYSLSYLYHDHKTASDLFRASLKLDPQDAYAHHYLAFNLDWQAIEQEEVESHYWSAIQIQQTHPWWWSRWISYLATRGRVSDARAAWRQAADSLSLDEGGSPEWIYLSLHRWVARWLLHWAELDFAEEILCSIPEGLAGSDTSIGALNNLLAALRVAENGMSVFPLSVPNRDWWSPLPHTDLPPQLDAQPLRSWLPARVESVDAETEDAWVTVGDRPKCKDGELTFREMSLVKNEIAESLYGFTWDEITEGRYIELAYYGDNNTLRIGLHRETQFRDPDLLPLVPPPDRWYRRAVNQAWKSKGAND